MIETMFTQQDNWLAQRLGKFTASEIHKLMKSGKAKDEMFGEVAETYINEKIAEILTGESKDNNSNKACEWGAANENDAILTFTEATGINLEYFGVANPMFFKYNAYSGGSPDGMNHTHIAEIKCPYTASNHIAALRASKGAKPHSWVMKKKPDHYAQMQFNMLCTGKKQAYYISYDPRTIEFAHRIAYIEIRFDAPFIDELTKRLVAAAEIVSSALEALQPSSTIIASPIPEGIMAQQA